MSVDGAGLLSESPGGDDLRRRLLSTGLGTGFCFGVSFASEALDGVVGEEEVVGADACSPDWALAASHVADGVPVLIGSSRPVLSLSAVASYIRMSVSDR